MTTTKTTEALRNEFKAIRAIAAKFLGMSAEAFKSAVDHEIVEYVDGCDIEVTPRVWVNCAERAVGEAIYDAKISEPMKKQAWAALEAARGR